MTSTTYVLTPGGRITVLVASTVALTVVLVGVCIPSFVGVLLRTMGLAALMGMQATWLCLRPQPWLWPLPGALRDLFKGDGAFGFRRKHETHTGVDLYCSEGQDICAVADGRVLLVTDFTGETAGSSWWNLTQAVLVEHDSRVVVYGELEPLPSIRRDMRVYRGQPLGKVLRVRKTAAERLGANLPTEDKSTTMLHLELWESAKDVLERYAGANAAVANDWPLDGKRPKGLLNPTSWLKDAEV